MTRNSFLREWAHHLSADGTYSNDPRFRITFNPTTRGPGPGLDDGSIVVHFGNAIFVAPDTASAISWMTSRETPVGSLRLGNVVSALTSSLGIPKCNECGHRQLSYNNTVRTGR